jgi:zinc transporter ZupT
LPQGNSEVTYLIPVAVVVVSVALGAALALAPGTGSRAIAPIRFFALSASLAVILAHLLPEAFERIGLWAGPCFAAGVLLPAALNRFVMRAAEPNPAQQGRHFCPAGLEAGYLGLLVHRFGDGMALAALTETQPMGPALALVLAALAAHAVPVVAVVTLAYLAQRGRRAAFWRAVVLALVAIGGVLAAEVIPLATFEAADGAVAAAVAGLLLHVVGHDRRSLLPARRAGWAANAAAAALGVSLGVLAALVH